MFLGNPKLKNKYSKFRFGSGREILMKDSSKKIREGLKPFRELRTKCFF